MSTVAHEGTSQLSTSSRTVGWWAAVSATALSIAYVVAQLAEWAGLLGSEGGPASSSTLVGIVLLLTPSLFLGSAFLLLMVCVHEWAPQNKKIWSHAAVAFATMYTVLISTVYFVQLRLSLRGSPRDTSLCAVTFPGAMWTISMVLRAQTLQHVEYR